MFEFIAELLSLLISLALAYAFIHSLLTHAVYWMEARLSYFQDPSQVCPDKWVMVKSFLFEFGLQFLRCLSLPFCAFKANPEPQGGATQKQVVVLIHGYGQTQTDWFWFQYQLKQAGIGPVYTLNLWNMLSGIDQHAETLKTFLQTIQAKHPDQPIQLIGHSMGGLVAAFYQENLNTDGIAIRKIITLGSPLHGTRLAGLGLGHSVEQMAPHADFLDALRQKISASTTCQYYHLASQLDNLIVPYDSALLDPMKQGEDSKQCLLSDLGHLRLLYSNQVLDQVKQWLAA